MAASQLHPCFQVRVIFSEYEKTEYEMEDSSISVKYKISFFSSCVNRVKAGKATFIPLELAQQIGGTLTVSVDEKRFMLIKPFLKDDAELLIDVAPIPWKVKDNSGMTFDLINIEKFDLLTNAVA